MTTPHKHADLIIAWAKGAEIEYYNWKGEWVTSTDPKWIHYVEYRIKPEKKWMRVAEYKAGGLVVYASEVGEQVAETSPSFKRWITDRVYYE